MPDNGGVGHNLFWVNWLKYQFRKIRRKNVENTVKLNTVFMAWVCTYRYENYYFEMVNK